MAKDILLDITGTVEAQYSEKENSCVCCETTHHRYGTKKHWNFSEEEVKQLEPYVDINTAIWNEMHKLPTGAKVKVTLELVN